MDALDTIFDPGVLGFGLLPGAENEAMGVSLEQNQSNLHYAAQYAMQQLGLDPTAQGTWSQSQMIAYVGFFKNFILSNPEFFTSDTVLMAQNINLSRPDYGDDILRVGGVPVADVGVAITDALKPAFDAIAPLAQTPAALAGLFNSSVSALNNAAKVASTGILTPLLFAALVIWGLSYASRPIREVKGIFS